MCSDEPSGAFPNVNYLWSRLLLRELHLAGAESFCISPGSRSTPLAMAAAELPEAKRFVHFDERALAFYALGRAKVSGRPSVLICTSGSAAANYAPAVAEAAQSRTPLVLLTADRPPELLDCGANQAIDQNRLFGTYPRWFCNLPCPPLGEFHHLAHWLRSTADQALYRAMCAPAGPVHLNAMFREPLAPTPEHAEFLALHTQYLAEDLHMDRPQTRYVPPDMNLAPQARADLAALLARMPLGLIIAGHLSCPEDRKAVERLAQHLGWPLLPDITSGLRLGRTEGQVLHHYDALLASPGRKDAMPHECVLHFGGPFVSKTLLDFLALGEIKEYIHIDGHPARQDPMHVVTRRYEARPGLAAEALRSLIPGPSVSKYAEELAGLSSRVEGTVDTWVQAEESLTEIHVARLVSRHLPAGSLLFLGNSMPIRDMDRYGAAGGPACTVIANRGASGIDGTVATALGAAEASGKPATAIIGDLAALHDLNALALAAKAATPFALVVVNNDGGGIFSFLPIAKYPEHFETLFGTPHGLSFEHAAALFGLDYVQPQTPDGFVQAYRAALQMPKATLIEIRSDRAKNLQHHRALNQAIASALEEERSVHTEE